MYHGMPYCINTYRGWVLKHENLSINIVHLFMYAAHKKRPQIEVLTFYAKRLQLFVHHLFGFYTKGGMWYRL
jgi:hypothetical protein